MKTVLTIAGFDPSSGAGVTADLAVFAAHGLFGTSAITAITVQTTVGVRSTHPVDADLLRETLEALDDDLPADGIKIGMLGTADCVAVVANFIEKLHRAGRRPVIVLDPVLRSSSGRDLLNDGGLEMLLGRLMPVADWATPNVDELRALNRREGTFKAVSVVEIVANAEDLQSRYPALGLVVTGGHLEPPDDLFSSAMKRRSEGLQPVRPIWLPGKRVETSATHGTGCAFSSALMSRLVLGEEPLPAARVAKRYVAEAMRRAVPRGRGPGPLSHLWPLGPSE